MANKRILIIDDDAELGEEIAECLRDEGHFAINIFDPCECMELIAKESFDIAIVDYKLPASNGIELLKCIKKSKPEMKVFIASGRPFVEKLIEEEKASHLVAGVISKPFTHKALLEKIGK